MEEKSKLKDPEFQNKMNEKLLNNIKELGMPNIASSDKCLQLLKRFEQSIMKEKIAMAEAADPDIHILVTAAHIFNKHSYGVSESVISISFIAGMLYGSGQGARLKELSAWARETFGTIDNEKLVKAELNERNS